MIYPYAVNICVQNVNVREYLIRGQTMDDVANLVTGKVLLSF
ncbi:hypothetical protein Daudx_1004 [Candidatus Desulforudis audaxviator]|nr:hypothetical protein Daudx_1004 [Candidatus Desulforudis audaxviator]